MLNISYAKEPVYYRVGTGESGVHIQGRFKFGNSKYCVTHGMKITKDNVKEFVDALFRHAGIPDSVKRPAILLSPNGRKRLMGSYFIKANIVVLYKHTLGILLHEVAHSVAAQMFRDFGHKQGFQAALSMLHVAARSLINVDSERMAVYNMLRSACTVK